MFNVACIDVVLDIIQRHPLAMAQPAAYDRVIHIAHVTHCMLLRVAVLPTGRGVTDDPHW